MAVKFWKHESVRIIAEVSALRGKTGTIKSVVQTEPFVQYLLELDMGGDEIIVSEWELARHKVDNPTQAQA